MHLRTILNFLPKSERLRLTGIFVYMFIGGVVETLSVISIGPFLAIAANPQWIETNKYIGFFYEFFKFQSQQYFLIAAGLLLILINVLSNATTLFILNKHVRFNMNLIYIISNYLHKLYFSQPYSFFLSRNSADLHRFVYTEVNFVVHNFFVPLLSCFQNLVIVVLLSIVVLVQSLQVAVSVVLLVLCVYAAINYGLRDRIKNYGIEAKKADAKRFMILKNGFESFKITKLLGLENFFTDSYVNHTLNSSRMQGNSQIMSMAPRYFVQSIGYIAIVAVTLFIALKIENLAEFIPTLGVYAYAFYRIMPKIQAIYQNIAKMRFTSARFKALDSEMRTYSQPRPEKVLNPSRLDSAHDFHLSVKDVSFCYENSKRTILDEVDFEIRKNQMVGILGKTGSGKTTLLDIMLGLLPPTSGTIFYKGHNLNCYDKSDWQNQVGYVPQEIVLIDTTILKNIAFGIPEEQINSEQVIKAAKLANIHEFITNDLSHGYQTDVGDRGIRLSGGQKQRLGIARALYRKPSILFFDEATSSLDTLTEKKLMKAIGDLYGHLTIVIVAHRLNTLKNCDFVIELEDGVVIKKGPFDSVVG
ncbi:ATP-binding cassette domain-containing protein [Verrucomicrobia bacterium]|nr:ATP-binding cassette domain-containing protein [Verrucomicrobiota bacterium]